MSLIPSAILGSTDASSRSIPLGLPLISSYHYATSGDFPLILLVLSLLEWLFLLTAAACICVQRTRWDPQLG